MFWSLPTYSDSSLKHPGAEVTRNKPGTRVLSASVCPAAQRHRRPLAATSMRPHGPRPCTCARGRHKHLEAGPCSLPPSQDQKLLLRHRKPQPTGTWTSGRSQPSPRPRFRAVQWVQQRKTTTLFWLTHPILRKGTATHHCHPSRCSRSCQPASRGCHSLLPSLGCGPHGLPSSLQ